MAMDRHLAGDTYPWILRWAALVSTFLFQILDMSIWGHKLIAVARMAGFNCFRMTYKPLYSTSIADFFNRIHWYLKEMFVTFFFFPTYLRYFKRYPRLRIFFATLAAAGFGNFIYHFLRYDRHIFEMGMWDALLSYHTYAVYGLLLGAAIGISQMRQHGKRIAPPKGWRRVRATVGVLLFYCLICFCDEENRTLTVLDYGSFISSLFMPWK
jgi:hypothetical protein